MIHLVYGVSFVGLSIAGFFYPPLLAHARASVGVFLFLLGCAQIHIWDLKRRR